MRKPTKVVGFFLYSGMVLLASTMDFSNKYHILLLFCWEF